jgi:hypothetical protein
VHARLPGFYSDRFGREAITIDYSEGTFRTEIRGVTFSGSLGELCPEVPLPPGAPFVLYEANDLCSCTFEWTLPVTLDGPAYLRAGRLACTLRIGEPEDMYEELRLVLHEDDAPIVAAVVTDGNFENAMWELTRKSLPPGVSLRACATCQIAEYRPYEGSTFLGGLGCCRGNRAELVAARAARGLAALARAYDNRTECVLETHVCPDYSARTPPVST